MRRRILVTAVCFAALGAAAAAQDAPPLLLSQPTAAPPGATLRSADSLPVDLDLSLVAALRSGDRIELAVDAQRTVRATVRQVEERAADRRSVLAIVDDDPESRLYLVLEVDACAGLIDAPLTVGRYAIGYVADGVHQVTPVRGIDKPDCRTTPGGPGRPNTAAGPAQDAPLPERERELEGGIAGTCAAPRRHFDVIIYYTTAARNEAGGTNAIQAQCQMAVDTANQTYADSQISPRFVLVHRAETGYVENASLEVDRDRLADPDDGNLDGAHPARNDYGADFVTLFVRASADGCGIAFCTPSGPEEGFCVVDWTCAVTNFTFAHEIGHLQGCAHNVEDAGSGCNEYCDSYGHRFFGVSGSGWRTVMSYNNDAESYTRIGRWSNPNISFDGRPCGRSNNCDDDRFNAATVNATTVGREDWRNPRFEVWVQAGVLPPWEGTYQVPWPTVVQGVGAIFSGNNPIVQPQLIIKEGTYPGAVTFNKRMTVNSCGGTARVGG